MKTAFVTVGTTSFDDLIAALTDTEAPQVLQDLGYSRLVLQIGRGTVVPVSVSTPVFIQEVYRYKSSLVKDIQEADLVISHAGAGSCLEVLEAQKPLLVVVNDKLMDNHQLELARQLHRDGHLFYCTCRTLLQTLQSMDLSTLKPFPPGKPEKFAEFLDKVVGASPPSDRTEPESGEQKGVLSRSLSPRPSFPTMQKGWKRYFGQKCLSEVTMDEYLASLGLYRKLTAKDASCLFRAVSEQVYACQIHHMAVRQACVSFLRKNKSHFESHVEGSFEKYLERLGDPQESAGLLEIKAFSLIYNRDFILYRHPGKPPSYVTDNGFEDKILLCGSSNGHYDSVYTKKFQANAAICQAVLYEILYKNVFHVPEVELRTALEMFRSGAKKNRNVASVGSEDANFDCPLERSNKVFSEKRVEDWDSYESATPPAEKCKEGSEQPKPSENPKMPFPYKVLKALDSEIYRNVEFDLWLENRKELEKINYLVFAGRQYYLGDKCQVRLETGWKYYNAHIQDIGQDMVTVFIEELAEKHVVPLVHLKPMTQVNPVPALTVLPSQRRGNYQKISDISIKSRKKLSKKVHGKDVYMTMTYSRGHPILPPRLHHGAPSRQSTQVPCSQPGGHVAPYEHYHQNSQRSGRGYGMPRWGAYHFVNRSNVVGPVVTYANPGKRYYHSYDNFSYGSRSYCHSNRQMRCVNKECSYGFLPENGEEAQGLEETITFYETEEEEDMTLSVPPNQGNQPPIVPDPARFWVARRDSTSIPPNKPTQNSSEEEMDEPSDNREYDDDYLYSPPDLDCDSTAVLTTTEAATNLDEGTESVSSQEGVASCSYSQKVMLNSAIISNSSCDNPSTTFPSSLPATSPSQNAVQSTSVSPLTMGVPVVIPSVPYPYRSTSLPPGGNVRGSGVVTPPYSCDPSGSDLPRDTKIVQYYFNLGLQYYQQTCWNPAMYVHPVPPSPSMEAYQTYIEPVPVMDHSAAATYHEHWRNDVHQVPVDFAPNGKITEQMQASEGQYVDPGKPAPFCLQQVLPDQPGFLLSLGTLSVGDSPPPHGMVYYPVATDPYSRQPPPCVPLPSAYHPFSPSYPVNVPYGNASQVHNTMNLGHIHQVGLVPASSPAPHYVAQNI
ncbi:UDP-N-acetylglucosamine transferase subunit ALG13 [Paroedura picta]|uniref:UDP-N-acetylglucosamine transferase subunit ALG13 n=1 Tax=Paroedura picta TaxID=143630 RepID=UPI004057743F